VKGLRSPNLSTKLYYGNIMLIFAELYGPDQD